MKCSMLKSEHRREPESGQEEDHQRCSNSTNAHVLLLFGVCRTNINTFLYCTTWGDTSEARCGAARASPAAAPHRAEDGEDLRIWPSQCGAHTTNQRAP